MPRGGDGEVMNCTHCAHYRPVEDGEMVLEYGECRFSPPAVLMLEEGPVSVWPQVYADDHCGQFKGKQ